MNTTVPDTSYLRFYVTLNAPKSERISQHHLESTQSEVHKPVCKAFRWICEGSTRKGCGHALDVHTGFHGNLRGKTAENLGAMQVTCVQYHINKDLWQ